MAELPPEIDTSRPHPARIYDYGLGGKNHFAADREMAEKAWATMPAGRTEVAPQVAPESRIVYVDNDRCKSGCTHVR
jgi:hypothetical protein